MLNIKNFSNLQINQDNINIKGRVIFWRDLGKLIFGKISDFNGIAQFSLSENVLENFKYYQNNIKVGDFIDIIGYIYMTKAGELTLQIQKCEILLQPSKILPDKWHGLKDEELKLRYRYVDLIRSVEEKNKFKTRFNIFKQIRSFLQNNDFIEVETPILQTIASGAAATPFTTQYKAIGENMYLRIAPELFLKRLVVAGFPKVFEIGKCFRNEGIDRTHLPEFTMLEFYQSYITYQELMDLSINLLQNIVSIVSEDLKVRDLDFNNIKRISYTDFLKENIKSENFDHFNHESVIKAAKELSLDLSLYPTNQSLLDAVYKKSSVIKTIQPTLVFDYPKSPLSKASPYDSRFSSQFQIILCGQEIIKACIEENDPEIQLKSFQEQKKTLAEGDMDSVREDIDFIEALEYGMPPVGGLGLGIDRLITILVEESTIRNVVLFPICK